MFASSVSTRRIGRTPGRAATLLTGLIVVSFMGLGTTIAAATAEQMYTETLAREEAVRQELDAADVPAGVIADARAVVSKYREVVRVYPRSGYSDNALWQAGRLSTDLFLRFGDAADRATAARLLDWLEAEYPSSSLLKELPAQLARLDSPPTARTEPPSSARTIATISAISREVLADAVRVTIEVDGEVSFHDERIPDPVRVFVDLPSTRLSPSMKERTIRFDGDTELIRQIRIGRHPNNVTRIVLEAEGVSSYSVYPLYNPYRLVIDSFKDPPVAPATLVRTVDESPRIAARAPLETAPRSIARLIPGLTPVGPERPASAKTSKPADPAPPVARAEPPTPSAPASSPERAVTASAPAPTAPPARNTGGGYSLARQLGLSVSRIVIDPGHGGHDPGAKGPSIEESELVLDVALRVEKLLEKESGIEVILTRRTDEYVPLEERTAIANREGADLFLSIHANASSNRSASGVETYFLNFATNMSAAAVAARENAASGNAMGALPAFLKQIALNNKLAESRDFASAVQVEMVRGLRRSNRSLKDLGVKQAPFLVLIGAAMPSVLAEISFVTNTQEAKLLRGNAYRQRIAESLVSAIRKYQGSLKSGANVAQKQR